MMYDVFETSWGWFGYAHRDGRLAATFLPRPAKAMHRAIRQRFPDAVESPNALPRFRREVIAYFDGQRTGFHVPVDLATFSPFQQAVLEACRRIPIGKTATYADLARAVGAAGAARAVGSVMAANPLPLVIPCHRVIRSDGSFGGFSSPRGVTGKRRLLQHEKAISEQRQSKRGQRTRAA